MSINKLALWLPLFCHLGHLLSIIYVRNLGFTLTTSSQSPNPVSSCFLVSLCSDHVLLPAPPRHPSHSPLTDCCPFFPPPLHSPHCGLNTPSHPPVALRKQHQGHVQTGLLSPFMSCFHFSSFLSCHASLPLPPSPLYSLPLAFARGLPTACYSAPFLSFFSSARFVRPSS